MGNEQALNCKNPCDDIGMLSRDHFRNQKTRTILQKKFLQSSNISDLIMNYIKNTPVVTRPSVHFASNIRYDGEWKGNSMTGKGVYVIEYKQSSYTYCGQFLDNKPHKQGKASFKNGNTYEGEWIQGKACGFGIFKHFNGAVYEGFWMANMQNGQGIESWPDGSKYQGSFKNGMKHGIGLYKWVDGNTYHGEWQSNEINGKGRFQWKSGRLYEGEWKQGKMDGYGKHVWEDGRIFQGKYQSDKKHGTGKYVWPDGKVFEGNWVNGKRQGRGKIIQKGVQKIGEWKNDERVRWIEQEENKNSGQVFSPYKVSKQLKQR